jgi:phosphoglycerate kinase
MLYSQVPCADLNNRFVFLRADLNVPLQGGTITSDFRLLALRPTLDLLIAKGARIILATHIGRPSGPESELSTTHLLPWFAKHGYAAHWASLKEAAQKKADLEPGSILLLENLRFYEGEETPSVAFATELRALGDYYVNDAFALLHRTNTSITLLPQLYAREEKTLGLLIERELKELIRLGTPERPYVVCMGGGKKDKIPFIEYLLDTADTIIVLPALAFTLLKAQGIETGHSLVDTNLLPVAHKILEKAQTSRAKLILPLDYTVALDSLDGPLITTTTLPHNGRGIAVGPASLELYRKKVEQARTIFLNGAMGFMDHPETMIPLSKLLHSIAQSNAFSMIGGGDSVAAVYYYNLERSISFCSTGGGSVLYFLSHGTFPALSYLDLV